MIKLLAVVAVITSSGSQLYQLTHREPFDSVKACDAEFARVEPYIPAVMPKLMKIPKDAVVQVVGHECVKITDSEGQISMIFGSGAFGTRR